MDISWLTIRDLQYIVAVAETTHFGMAAMQCHVSQPAMSTQIKKCETLLGTPFFERTKRKVIVTEYGAKVVEQARRILYEAGRMADLAQSKSKPLTGKLRLGGIATVSPYLTPFYLATLKKKYPQLELTLHEGYTDDLIKDLKRGTLDVVIASPTFDEHGLELTHLYFEPFMLAFPVGHAIEKEHDLLPSKLKETDLVLLSDGHCLSDQVLQACAKIQQKSHMEFQATSLMTLLQVVAIGTGYTIVPVLAAIEDPRLKGLIKYKHFANQRSGRIVTLVAREGFALKSDILSLKELIQSCLPKSVKPL
jgi:LysR family hydrogen peroxide-inducible transcriptional activator